MNPLVYLAFGLAMTTAGMACLLLLPRFRTQLRVLRAARRITETDAALKLRFFVLLTALAFIMGLLALGRFVKGSPSP